MPTVSIIIVNYEVKNLLLNCLGSLKKFNPSGYSLEIIVVDNNSSDGSCEAIKKQFPDVILIENKINRGFSAANNQGIIKAKGEILFLLNPDTELKDDSISFMFNYVSDNSSDVIAAPRLLNNDKTLQNSCYKFPKVSQVILETFYLHFIFNMKTYDVKDLKFQMKVDALSGAALIFKKDLIQKIGLVDENLFWMEDIDFCFRNVSAGGVNMYLPQALIMHHSGQSSKNNLNISVSNQIISKIKFFKKHSKNFEIIPAIVFSYLHIITRLIAFAFLSLFFKTGFLKFKAYIFTIKKLTIYLFNGINELT